MKQRYRFAIVLLMMGTFFAGSAEAQCNNRIKVLTFDLVYCEACSSVGYVFVDDCRGTYQDYNCELCSFEYRTCYWGGPDPCLEPVGTVCESLCT